MDVEGNGHPKKPKTAQTYSAAFEAWWKVYPKRAGKRDANKAWIAAGKRLKIERDTDSEGAAAFMLERAEAFAKAIQGTDDQFIPHPATWLNAAKYDDDPAIWKPRKASDNGQQLRLPHSCDDGIKHPGTVNW